MKKLVFVLIFLFPIIGFGQYNKELAGLYIYQNGIFRYTFNIKKNGKVVERIENGESGRKLKTIGSWSLVGNKITFILPKKEGNIKTYQFLILKNCLANINDRKCIYKRLKDNPTK